MKLTIQNKHAQPSLRREEVTARIFFTDETPSRVKVASALANELNVKQELVVVSTIKTQFGDSSANVTARVYEDAEVMKHLERENLLAKHHVEEPEPEEPEEAPAEEGDESEEAEESADTQEDSAEEPSEEKPAE